MNQEDGAAWASLFPSADEDFTNLLDFDGLGLDFSTFDPNNEQGQEAKDHFGGGVGLDQAETMYGVEATGTKTSLSDTGIHRGQTSAVQVPQRGYQQRGDNPHHAQNFMHAHGNVPPTPTSMEIQGNRGQFLAMDSQQAWRMHEAHLRKQQDQMIFTPLVSPAVTPLDSQFQMPEYAIPGEYFSPLSSPALQAQSQAAHRSVYGTALGSRKPETTPPADSLTAQISTSAAPSPPAAKRSKKKPVPASSKSTPRTVRESPSMKPQRKKQTPSTTIPSKEIATVLEISRSVDQHGPLQSRKEILALPASQTTSESGSISPEYLSEILMPPPATPRPGSARRSPHLGPEKASQSVTSQPVNAPATPASLMRISKPGTNHDSQAASLSNTDQAMNDMSLPPAVMDSKHTLSNIDTRGMHDQTIPTNSAQARGEMNMASSTSTPVPPSPASSASFASKIDPKPLAKGKKRNSSSIPSPALRPRISPSIKPLLPEGTVMNAETSALLLASKSNYQNILEGTHLPGVSYPEALSENLTSKRTSHKIAEQGRRNRINGALQEIALLLPAGSTPQLSSKEEKNLGTAAQQSNSKASTVEMAIDYIKALQAELKEVKDKLEVAEGKLNAQAGGAQEEATTSDQEKEAEASAA